MLQHAISLGYIIKKINWVIHSKQKDFLKPYVEKHTELKKEASINGDSFRVAYHNVFNYRDFTIANNRMKAMKRSSKVNFFDSEQISKNIQLFEMTKINVLLDKPIQVGFVILEIIKVIMHKLWVQLKEIFGDRIFLMYTDTDRFKVHIESEDTYQEFMTHFKDKMDTSNIKKDTRLPYIPGLNRKY